MEYFDLTDLKLIVSIGEMGSVTGAAGQSFVSVAAASTRIKKIEDRLGTKLLNRTSRGVTLTPAGQAVLDHGRVVLHQLEQLKGDLNACAQGVKGHVRIFANTTSISEFLPSVLGRYLAAYPAVDIDLKDRLSFGIVSGVREGIVDFGVASGSVCTDGLEVIPYRQYRLVLASPPNHPLTRRESILFNQTLDYDYVGLTEGSAIQMFLSHAAKSVHKPLRLRVQVGSFESLCRMVEAKVGIGILPESAARRYASKAAVYIKQLSDPWAACDLKICIRNLKSLSAHARKLIDLLIADGERSRRIEHRSK